MNLRDIKSLSAGDMAIIRENDLGAYVLTDTPRTSARMIPIYGLNGVTGQQEWFLLDDCTGELYDSQGEVIYTYPGDWDCGD